MRARDTVHQAVNTALNADPNVRLAGWSALLAILGYSVQGCSSLSYVFYAMSGTTAGVLSDRIYDWSGTLFGAPRAKPANVVVAKEETPVLRKG